MCLIYLYLHLSIHLFILWILVSIPFLFSSTLNNPTDMMDGIGVGGIDYEDKLTSWLIQYHGCVPHDIIQASTHQFCYIVQS